MKEIQQIDYENCIIYFNDGSHLTLGDFNNQWIDYFTKRVAGETLSPMDMERFFKRSGGKNLKELLRLKKAEGFLEASVGKPLSKKAWSIIGMATIIIVILIVVVILKNMGLIPI